MTLPSLVKTCTFPQEYLYPTPWEEIPSDIQNTIMHMSGLPCDGSGVLGSWCTRTIPKCPWSKTIEAQITYTTKVSE